MINHNSCVAHQEIVIFVLENDNEIAKHLHLDDIDNVYT